MTLESFERKIAVLVEGIFAKGSPRGIEPAELGRRLTREIERSSRIGVRSQIAPNRITVALSPVDAEELAPLRRTVERDLAELAQETIDDGGFQTLGPVSVTLASDEELKSGTFYIDCEFVEEQGYGDRYYLEGAGGGRITLAEGAHSIGRQADSSITLDDPRVSRRHAEIVVSGGIVTVYDLGSTNGTFVNGVRLSKPTELTTGDVITVGTTDLTLFRG